MKKRFWMTVWTVAFVLGIVLGIIGAGTIKAHADVINSDIKANVVAKEVKEYLEEDGTLIFVDSIAVRQDAGEVYRLYVRVHNIFGDEQIVYGLFNIQTGDIIRSWSYSIIDGQGCYEEAYGEDCGRLDCIPLYQ